MNWNDIIKLSKAIARDCRPPYHAPIEENKPCEDAYLIARIISEIDYLNHQSMDLPFGGAGDMGEILAGYLDILIEMGLISFSRAQAIVTARKAGADL